MRAGIWKFELHGEKLSGTWAIVLMRNRGKGNEWLLIKKKDDSAQSPFNIDEFAYSVKTRRTQDEIARDLPARAPAASDMPDFIPPMTANLTGDLPRGKDWIFEVKWDGVRGLVYIDHGSLRIYTRNNNRCEKQYPELQAIAAHVKAKQAILDGEIVMLDEHGVSKFELIQPRIHTQTGATTPKPVHYYAFDLLYLDGRDLRDEPLKTRKELLAKIVNPFSLLRVSESFEGGEELLEVARQNGLEGLIAKRAGSKYVSKRSSDWLKLKLTSEQEFVIAGYTPGIREYFGSLALGVREDGKLHYVGNVGTGFNDRSMADLWRRLEPLKISKRPFASGDKILKGTEWVQPELVAQIKFANWTDDRKLRAPVFLGLRGDKPADEVVEEKPVEETQEKLVPTLQSNPETTRVKFTNLNKVYYPADGITKGDVIHYYDTVADLILPHLKDRPLSLKRYPNGIDAQFFFQKNTPESYPSWLRTETIDGVRYVLTDDKDSLMYLANLGCIDQNPAMSRVGSIANPDFILIDLDPVECPFAKVVEAALLVKEKLDKLALKGYPKTTGGDGMHIYVPIEPHYTFEQARSFAEIIARMLAAAHPKLFTTPRAVAKREKDRVYFDYMQIAEFKTISAPYVPRAYAGAPVSTPLAWDEVTKDLHPSQFHLRNAPERFARVGDLFSGVLKKPQKIEKAFGKLEKLARA